MAVLKLNSMIKSVIGSPNEVSSSTTLTLSAGEHFRKSVTGVTTTPELILDMSSGSFGAFAIARVSVSADCYVIIRGATATNNVCLLVSKDIPLILSGSANGLGTYDATAAYATVTPVNITKISVAAVTGTATVTVEAWL